MPRGNGGVLGPANIPTTSVAKGVWSLMEQQLAQRQGIWPIVLSSDPYFDYTTLLLPGNGTNGAQNNTFLDGSTNNFTITRNGNTTQGTFSPFSQTGWGNYFNGSSYLSAGTTLFNYTTGNASTTTFTIEAFIYLNSYQTATNIWNIPSIIGKGDVYLNLGVNGSGNLIFYHYDGTGRSITGSSVIPLATWTYVAVTVTGGTATLYVNGTSVGSGTWYGIQAAGQNTTSLIGRASTNASSLYINGYISNLRVSTVARTIATPTTAYANDANTALLTAQSNRFIDNSSSPITLTVTGSPTVVAFSPFNPSASWSAATYGGSGYFDGAGDYLTAPDNAAFAMGTDDFTVECFIYTLSSSSTSFTILDTRNADFDSTGFVFYRRTTGKLTFGYVSGGAFTTIEGATTINANAWYHVMVTRSSNSVRLFVNGNLDSSAVSVTNNFSRQANTRIAAIWSDTNACFGYISSFRILKGTALQTSSFSFPTAPLTAITNTSLLLNFTNAGIYDATSKNDLETVGNAQISNTTAKWGSTSMSFDKTGDWLAFPSSNLFAFGTGDFTIEAWGYPSTVGGAGSSRGLFQITSAAGLSTSTTNSLAVATTNPSAYWGGIGANAFFNSTTAAVANTWYHLALVRNSGTTKLYVNGTSVYSFADTTNYTCSFLTIAGYYDTNNLWNGYIQDFRVTKGYARYTANFTPPTAAFPTL